jgi:hypothetical protein
VQFLDSRGEGEGGPPAGGSGQGGSTGSTYVPSGGGSDADFPSSATDDDIPF